MAMSKAEAEQFRLLSEAVQALREGLQAALERLAELEAKPKVGRPPKN